MSNFIYRFFAPRQHGGFAWNLSPASYLIDRLMPKTKNPENRYNGIEVQKSIYGDAVPLIYGQQRIAWVLGWYAGFKATPHTDSGGGKGGGGGGAGQSAYTYSASLLGFVCEGPIGGIGNVWADKSITTLSALGLTLFSGTGGQATWSFLTSNYSAQAIPYDHTAYLANGAFDLKDSPALPNLSFEVNGLCQYGSGINDAEPSAVLTDYCTDANHGCNFNALGDLTNYRNYCKSMGFFISPLETTQRPAMDFIKELLDVTNSQAFESSGVLNIMPLSDVAVSGNGASYTPNLTPIYSFTDDDYIHEEDEDPVQVSTKAQSDIRNVIRLEYLNRGNNYNTAIMEASDAQDIALNGLRVASTKTSHMVTTPSVARTVTQIWLQRGLYYVNGYQWKARADYSLLEPLDIVALTDTGLGLINQLVRIFEVEDSEEDELTITAEEMPVGPGGAPQYNWQAEQGYYANFASAPGSIQPPKIFTAPSMLVDTQGGYEIWIAACGPSGSGNWGGCRVLMSFDNVQYKNVGTIYGGARHGTITSSIASVADIDVTSTLGVQLSNTAMQLPNAVSADAENNRTLIYVDGEIMAYGGISLTGAGAYNLIYLRRGQYSSAITSHSSGTWFIRLDGAIFKIPFDPGMFGQTVYFKFQSFNIVGGGLEDISSLTAYTYTIANAQSLIAETNGLTLIARGNCAVAGTRLFKKPTGSVSWDSDVYSLQSYSSGCSLTFSADQTTKRFVMGLNTDPLTDSSYTSVDYFWNFTSGGTAIAQAPSGSVNAGTYTTDSVFKIEYDGQLVKFIKDGALVMAVEDRGETFFFDSSFLDLGVSVRNVGFAPMTAAPSIPWIVRGNCVATLTTIKKNGGVTAWDSDCYSYEAYANGCSVTFQPESGHAMIGLNTDPSTDSNYTSLDYAWEYDVSGGSAWLYIQSTGANPLILSGTLTTNTILSITYDGRFVRFLAGGAVVATYYKPDQTFYMDSSFYYANSSVRNVSFMPMTAATPAPFLVRGNCFVSDNQIKKIGGGTTWDSDCYSINGYTTCHVAFKPSNTTTSFMVGLNEDPLTDSSYVSLDFAWYCDSGTARIYENGTAIAAYGSYTTSDVFTITYDAATITYLKNGVSIRTVSIAGKVLFMDSSFYHPGAGANSVVFGPTEKFSAIDTAQLNNNAVTEFQNYTDTTVYSMTSAGTITNYYTISTSDYSKPFYLDLKASVTLRGVDSGGSAGVTAFLQRFDVATSSWLNLAYVYAGQGFGPGRMPSDYVTYDMKCSTTYDPNVTGAISGLRIVVTQSWGGPGCSYFDMKDFYATTTRGFK